MEQQLNALYNGPTKVYNVNPALERFISRSERTVDMNHYVAPIKTVRFGFEMSIDVDKYLERVGKLPELPSDMERNFLATHASARAGAPSSEDGAANSPGLSAEERIKESSFIGDPMTNLISVLVDENTSADPKVLRLAMLANMDNAIKRYVQTLGGGDVNEYLRNASHTEFDRYLTDIFKAACYTYLEEMRKKLQVDTQTFDNIKDVVEKQKSKDAQRIRNLAIRYIQGFFGEEYEKLKKDLNTASLQSMELVLAKIPEAEHKAFVTALSKRTNMPQNEYYFMVRSSMINVFKNDTVKHIPDMNVAMFVRKTIIDMYIKACYPLALFNYITVLMNRYSKNGDFVQARHALLAKLMYTYKFTNDITNRVSDGDIPRSIRQHLPENLTHYLQRNNKGNAYSGENTTREMEMTKIVKDLQAQSDAAWDATFKNSEISKAIAKHQLDTRTMRNTNVEVLKKMNSARTWYLLSVWVLLFFIVGCSGLLLAKRTTHTIQGVSGVVCLVVIAYIYVWVRNALR